MFFVCIVYKLVCSAFDPVGVVFPVRDMTIPYAPTDNVDADSGVDTQPTGSIVFHLLSAGGDGNEHNMDCDPAPLSVKQPQESDVCDSSLAKSTTKNNRCF